MQCDGRACNVVLLLCSVLVKHHIEGNHASRKKENSKKWRTSKAEQLEDLSQENKTYEKMSNKPCFF